MAGNDMPLFTSGKPRLPMACLRAWEQYNEPSLISVAGTGGLIYLLRIASDVPASKQAIKRFITLGNEKKEQLVPWNFADDEVKSKKWTWLSWISFRNIITLSRVEKFQTLWQKHKGMKQTVTQWLFLRRLATNRRCKFLLEDTSMSWQTAKLSFGMKSRECHASDGGDMSPRNEQRQIWAWHLIYSCGAERSRTCKLNRLKGQQEEFPVKDKQRQDSWVLMSRHWSGFLSSLLFLHLERLECYSSTLWTEVVGSNWA